MSADDALHVAFPGVGGKLWADAHCPTCDFWIHRNDFVAGFPADQHAHTEDEIIFVIEGTMVLGKRQLSPGDAIAVDANTVYGFTAGEEGLSFVTFRTQNPYYVVGTRGKSAEPLSEYEMFHDAAVPRLQTATE